MTQSEPDQSQEQPVQSTCTACGAGLEDGAAFCAHCGANVRSERDATPEDATTARSRRQPIGDAVERARGRHEFGRIKGIVFFVRSLFWVGAGVVAVLLLLSLAAEDTDDGLRTVWIALLAAGVALSTAGALFVVRAPLVWTTVSACWWTLDTALSIAWLEFSLGLSVRAFLTVAFWFAVAQAARIQRLMAADPSLQIVRKRIDAGRRVTGGIRDRTQERQSTQRQQRRRGRLRLGAIAAAVAVLGFGAIWLLSRPPSVGSAVEAFAAKWSSGDVEGLGASWFGDAGPREAQDLHQDLERRGWLPPPRLGAPATEEAPESAVASFSTPVGTVRVDFWLRSKVWSVRRVSLPDFVAPDVGPAIDAFRRAWAAKGADAVLAAFRPASRERLGDAVRRMLEKRDWIEQRPPLGDVDPGQTKQLRARVLFAIGNGELSVTFEYWHPGWVVTGIGLPQQ